MMLGEAADLRHGREAQATLDRIAAIVARYEHAREAGTLVIPHGVLAEIADTIGQRCPTCRGRHVMQGRACSSARGR